MNYLHRAWAEIDLDALLHNFRIIKNSTTAKIFSVVKADAYGHSVKAVAPVLDKAGTDYFAVSNIEEAKELRWLGIQKPILILGYTPPEMAEELREYRFSQTVFSLEYAKKLHDYAAKADVFVRVHLKLDTGMGRIGFNFRDDGFSDLEEVKTLKELNHLTFEGVFTHFAVADTDPEYTKAQFKRFISSVKALEESGFSFFIKHCCNSAALINHKEMHLVAVRPGIILYGLTPDESMSIGDNFRPVMTFKSVVSLVKNVKAGETVSYGKTYTFKQDSKIATVTAGYADGLPRLLSNNGFVLIKGQKAPIVGRICMDQFCCDVTDIEEVSEGDTVILFGKDLPVEEVAKNAQTINYEIVCGLSKRVPRIYIKDEKELDI